MIVEDILKTFNEMPSIKTIAKKVGCSWNRVVKVLSSNGIIINDTHKVIMKLHDEGKTVGEITKQIGYGIKTVQVYIPTVRSYYNVDLSENHDIKRTVKCSSFFYKISRGYRKINTYMEEISKREIITGYADRPLQDIYNFINGAQMENLITFKDVKSLMSWVEDYRSSH